MVHILVTFKSYLQVSCGPVSVQSPFERNMSPSFEVLKINAYLCSWCF